AHKKVLEKRDPLEARFFNEQQAVDEKAQALLKKNPKKAKAYLTQVTIDRMNEVHQLFKELKLDLISEFTNNKQGI
ncbi:MAG: hypothetical protein N4A74_23725, partial [Carboxylicivirga sp.]|nr:hypothetical protein [Carboxylicivirga sp.]